MNEVLPIELIKEILFYCEIDDIENAVTGLNLNLDKWFYLNKLKTEDTNVSIKHFDKITPQNNSLIDAYKTIKKLYIQIDALIPKTIEKMNNEKLRSDLQENLDTTSISIMFDRYQKCNTIFDIDSKITSGLESTDNIILYRDASGLYFKVSYIDINKIYGSHLGLIDINEHPLKYGLLLGCMFTSVIQEDDKIDLEFIKGEIMSKSDIYNILLECLLMDATIEKITMTGIENLSVYKLKRKNN